MSQNQSDSNFSVKMQCRKKYYLKKRNSIGKNGVLQSKNSSGKWTLNEIKLYIEFLKLYKVQINSYVYRREIKIFKLMSNYIKTRTSDQCRSHHQKVQKIHPDIDQIIEYYGNKVQTSLRKVRLNNEKQNQEVKDTDKNNIRTGQNQQYRLTQNKYGLNIAMDFQNIREI